MWSYFHHQKMSTAYLLTHIQGRRNIKIFGIYRSEIEAKKAMILHFFDINFLNCGLFVDLLRDDTEVSTLIDVLRRSYIEITVNQLLHIVTFSKIHRAIIKNLDRYLELTKRIDPDMISYDVSVWDTFEIRKKRFDRVIIKNMPDYCIEYFNRML
jgi:hypothetical protein